MKSQEEIANEYFRKACGLLDNKKYENAIIELGNALAVYQKAKKSNMTRVGIIMCLEQRGGAYCLLNKYPQAIDDFTECIEGYEALSNQEFDGLPMNPGNGYQERAIAYHNSGVLDKALADYIKSIEWFSKDRYKDDEDAQMRLAFGHTQVGIIYATL